MSSLQREDAKFLLRKALLNKLPAPFATRAGMTHARVHLSFGLGFPCVPHSSVQQAFVNAVNPVGRKCSAKHKSA